MGWKLFVCKSLISMQDKISKAIEENEYSIGICFDFAKAFDTINHAILLKKLSIYGVPGVQLSWFTSYFINSRCIAMAPSQNYLVFFSEFLKVLSLALLCLLFTSMTYQMPS